MKFAGASSPTVVAIVELGKWFASKGVKNVFTMNIGGIIHIQGVKITMTRAIHTSSVDEEPFAYVGVAAGYVIEFSNGRRIYHAGDTAAFSDFRSGQFTAGELSQRSISQHGPSIRADRSEGPESQNGDE